MAARDYYLTFVAGRILKLLGSEETMRYIGSLSRAQQEILKGLKKTISELAPVLLDAEKKSNMGNRGVKDWLTRLEDVLGYAENLVDELSTEALHQSLKRAGNQMADQVRNCFIPTSFTPNWRLDMYRTIWRLEDIAAKGRHLKLEELSEKQVIFKPDKHGIVEEEEVLFEKDKYIILQILLDQDPFEPNVDVLQIIGEKGTGKTTLANNVFNEKMVQNRFEIRIWVTASHNFNKEELLRDILTRATNGKAVETTLELEKATRDSLRAKLCLIVFDDYVRRELGSILSCLLPLGAKGSKLVIISRGSHLAYDNIEVSGHIRRYFLNVLDSNQSWLLFEKMALGQKPKRSHHQMAIGRKIVLKCRGHIMSLKAVAALLSFEKSEEAWRLIYNEFLTLIGTEYDYDDDVLGVIRMCYGHLALPLKQCFAYCRLFPEDHEYDVQTLIELWMAQGFIAEQPGQSLEDVGYGYVLELLNRCFFQVTQIDVRQRVIKFRIQDLIREAMFTEPDQWYYSGRTSHVSIDFREFSTDVIEQLVGKNFNETRSIIFQHHSQRNRTGVHDHRLFDFIVYRFSFLRTLDMHAMGINTVPYSIEKMKLLKYLDLSENGDIIELPNSMTKLLNLQTLKLSSCYGLKALPRDFGKMINLRHLEMDGCYNLTSLPRGISQLPNLQISSQLEVSEGSSPNIGRNTFTKEVHVKNLGYEKFDMDKYLKVIPEVRSLSLEWESSAPESVEHEKPLEHTLLFVLEELNLQCYRGKSLFTPDYPIYFVKLSLRRCVNCRILPPLDQLCNLKVLVLDELNALEYISDNDCSSGASVLFPSLKELWLTELPKLQGWWRSNGVNTHELPSFSCLSKLVIEDCPALTSMPLFPTLEDGLALDSTCWKPFQLTLNQKIVPSSSSSLSSPSLPLTKLKALRIVGIEDFNADDIAWETLQSLLFLRFDFLPNLVSLTEGLQQVVSLQELHLWRCGVEKIPEWIGELQNLRKLVIRMCPRLESLPETICRQLLETLEIEECDTLLRRCQKKIGADWEKIRFIKNLHLGRIYDKRSIHFLVNSLICKFSGQDFANVFSRLIGENLY